MDITPILQNSKYKSVRGFYYFLYAPFVRVLQTPIVFIVFRLILLLPIRIGAKIKENLLLKYRVPYSKKINIYVSSQREIRRGGFINREKQTAQWAEACGKEGGVLYDIGANIGMVSLIFTSNAKVKSEVYAFEPHVPTFACLNENSLLMRNDRPDTPIHVFNLAASSQSTLTAFEIYDAEAGSSGHQIISSVNLFKNNIVFSITLDDFCYKYKAPFPNYLKIDVDGFDFEVLKGADKILSNGHICSVLIEKNDKEHEIRNFLQKHNMKEVELTGYDAEINLLFERE